MAARNIGAAEGERRRRQHGESPDVAPEQARERLPDGRRDAARVELPELELLVVAAHLRPRSDCEAESLDEARGEIVELQLPGLTRAQERRLVERAHEGERLVSGLSTRCALQEGVDQIGELVGSWARLDEQVVDLEWRTSRPAIDQLVEQLLGRRSHASSHSLRRGTMRWRAW